MNIEKKVRDLLLEALEKKYQKQFNVVYSNWKQTYSEMDVNDAEEIYKTYRSVLPNLNMNNEVVVQFLNKHTGKFGRRKLELSDVQNIERLTINELLQLLRELNKYNKKFDANKSDLEKEESEKQREIELEKIFSQNDVISTPEKIAQSKSMWYDESRAKISEGSVRAYEIMNQEEAIRMGYYYQFIHAQNATAAEKNKSAPDYKKFGQTSPWCTTWRGRKVEKRRIDADGNEFGPVVGNQMENMYSFYRGNGISTFYFIIDESKPIDDNHHFAALQVLVNGGLKLTGQFNNQDAQISWDDLFELYPELEDHKNKLTPRANDTKESKRSIVDIINEIEGDENEFSIQDVDTQLEFINAGGIIRKPKSWKGANKTVRDVYITTIIAGNINTKLSTIELIQEVIKTSKGLLNSRLKSIGYKEGIKSLIDYVLKDDYLPVRKNILNDNIILYKRKSTNTYYLYDIANFKWYESDGVVYANLSTTEKNVKLYKDNNRNMYYVRYFTKGGNVDKNTLYTLYLISQQNNPQAGGFYFTFNKWEELIKSGMIKPEGSKLDTPDIKQDADIKEQY